MLCPPPSPSSWEASRTGKPCAMPPKRWTRSALRARNTSSPPIAPRSGCLLLPRAPRPPASRSSSPAPAARRICPGMTASLTELPVFGVPIESKALSGIDSLYSIVQMPAGVPVGTLAIGKAGAINAALLAASVLALNDPTPGRPACRLAQGADRGGRRASGGIGVTAPHRGEAEAGRHHRNSRRRTVGPDAGDGGGAARAAMPGVFAGPGFAGVRRGAERAPARNMPMSRRWNCSPTTSTSSPTNSRTCRPRPRWSLRRAVRCCPTAKSWRPRRTASPKRIS